jgi:hypothetical protein
MNTMQLTENRVDIRRVTGLGWDRRGGRAPVEKPPYGKGFRAAMSSSPWEGLWNGDEDVAAPFGMGTVFICAHGMLGRVPWVDVCGRNWRRWGSTRLPESIPPMLDPLTSKLLSQLRFADASAVLELLQAQMAKRPRGKTTGEGTDSWRRSPAEIIRHCEEAAEFCASGTTEERRGEILAAWYRTFEPRVQKALEKVGASSGLFAADLDIVRGAVVDPFFTDDVMSQVLREDSLAIYAGDLRRCDDIIGWFEAGSPLAVFLFGRGTAQAAKDATRRRGYLQRGLEPRVVRCLALLNGVVNDPLPWPDEMVALANPGPETEKAGQVSGSGIWERRRYRRMLLNDLFVGALDRRMGYSPRLGTLSWYLENRLIGSRLRDELDRYIRQQMRGSAADAVPRKEYPLLDLGQIVAFAGFVEALADPGSVVGRHWMEAIARVDPVVAERCRMEGQGVGGIRVEESELVRCLNAAMQGAVVIPAGVAEDTEAPAAFRTFLAVASRVYRLTDQNRVLFNRRILEIGFPGWVPEARPVVWDEVAEPEEDEESDEDQDEDGDMALPVLLRDPYLRAVLDLLLVARIPPERFGLSTLTRLALYGAEAGVPLTGMLDELVRRFQVEYVEAVCAWERLEAEGGKDERDREAQSRGVAEGEEVLGRVMDATVREVISRFSRRMSTSAVGLGGESLRDFLREVAEATEIGVMEQALKGLRSAKGGRGAADACAVVEYALAWVRLARAEARILVNVGERKAYETHRGRWVRSQAQVGDYLGRDQSTIQRALRKKSPQGTLLSLATGFAELRLQGYRFENEDADPVGPDQGTPGKKSR